MIKLLHIWKYINFTTSVVKLPQSNENKIVFKRTNKDFLFFSDSKEFFLPVLEKGNLKFFKINLPLDFNDYIMFEDYEPRKPYFEFIDNLKIDNENFTDDRTKEKIDSDFDEFSKKIIPPNRNPNEDKRKLNSSKSKSIRDLRDKTEEEKRQSDLKNKGHENQNRVEKNESKQALKESQQTEDF
jgi:hypothetical protein